ncbi:MAG TPA: hypothetical protein VHN80_14495 [Kineosporiaceae bacterium]|jgi:hypothetical protein|nr:hypothetical protein [Kineosporiaceae bacterium]
MIPLSDGAPTRCVPWVNLGLIVATVGVFVCFGLPRRPRARNAPG